jgi:hypothetical protein
MKWQFLAFLFMVKLSLFCTDPPGQRDKARNDMENDKGQKNKPAGSYSDTIKVNGPSAVFYNPDSVQLEKLNAITDTMILESTIHDCFYQMRNARNSLQRNWPEIKIVEIRNAGCIRFQLLDGKSEYVNLDSLDDPCGILVFDGNKKSRLVDMMNIDSELGFYFSE